MFHAGAFQARSRAFPAALASLASAVVVPPQSPVASFSGACSAQNALFARTTNNFVAALQRRMKHTTLVGTLPTFNPPRLAIPALSAAGRHTLNLERIAHVA
jgi:hypothetical protein